MAETWLTKPLWDDVDWNTLDEDEAESNDVAGDAWEADDLQAAVRRQGGRLPGSDPRR